MDYMLYFKVVFMKEFCGAIFDMSGAGKNQGFADFINGCLGCVDVAIDPKGDFFCPGPNGQPVPGAPVVSFPGDGDEASCDCSAQDRADPTLLLALVGSVVFVGGALIYFRNSPRVEAFIRGVSGACNAVGLRLTAPAQEGSAPLVASVGSHVFSDLEAGGAAGVSAEALRGTGTGTGARAGEAPANPVALLSYQNLPGTGT